MTSSLRPHPLISESRKILSRNSKDQPGWMVSSSVVALDIRVTESLVERALLFMDKLIRELRLKGYNIECSKGQTNLLIKEEKIRVACRERTRMVEKQSDDGLPRDYEPTGDLIFKAHGYCRFEWKDGDVRIEDQTVSIIQRLERKIDELHQYRDPGNEKITEKKDDKKKDEDLKQRKEKELFHFKELLDDAMRWNKANIIRAYLQQNKSKPTPNVTDWKGSGEWHIWATEKLDWYDPLIDAYDELLSGVNKTTLQFEAAM